MQKNTSYFISIDKISSKGFGVGSFQKNPQAPLSKVMVPGTVPGDAVLAEVGPKRKGVFVGKLLEVLTPSSDRVALRCVHAPFCGGCSLQQMSYESQLSYKEEMIKNLFEGSFAGSILPILPSSLIWQYRNKMEYTFSQNREGHRFLGLILAASKGRVESLKECHLTPSWFVEVLQAVKAWWEESSLLAFNGLKNTGSLRNLTLREGKKTLDKMVMLTVSGVPAFALNKEELKKFVIAVQQKLPEPNVSIFLRVQQAIPGQVTQFFEMQLAGPAHICEELEISVADYKRIYQFKISPTAFFQPNTLQAEVIYAKALEMAGRKKRKWVLDLYAGTATLGMIFAPFAEKVLAVELNPYAVFDAQMNKELNQVDNLEILQGDVAQVLCKVTKEDSSLHEPDLVLLDPPRTGLSSDALTILTKLAPKEIIYISCAPATQVRDCLVLQQVGYEIVQVQPIDQFPHTVHVENIVLLRR